MPRRFAALLLFMTGCAFALAGCGGGGGSNNTPISTPGTLLFNITWPAARAAAPPQSVTVILTSNSTQIAQQTVAHTGGQSSSTITFNSVPTGQLIISATAFASTDGSGTALGAANVAKTVLGGATSQVTLDLNGAAARLLVVPSAVSLVAGEGTTLVASETDLAGNLVLIGTGDLQWSSSVPTTATVDINGNVVAIAVGNAIITATDVVTSKTATATVNVTSGAFIVPVAVTLTLGDKKTFSASFSGNPPITWTVAEGAAGGTIDTAGNYTAPNTPGTFHVVATNTNDPTQTASATVTVTAGTGTIVVK